MSAVPGAFAKNFQCECCKNPWNVEDTNAPTSSVPASLILCAPCLTDNKGYSGVDPTNFDMSVKPSENFYLWSNGGWKEKNPIPPEYSSWNTFIALRDLNLERLKTILDELEQNKVDASGEGVENPTITKVKDFFLGFMDAEAIEAAGAQGLYPILRLMENIRTDVPGTLAALHSQVGLSSLFSLYSSPDKADSNHTIASLYQGGLGMPDRDYYFDHDKAEKRQKYVAYIAQLLSLLVKEFPEYEFLLGHNESTTTEVAKSILQLETTLAQWHLTRTQSRDPKLTYNKMTVAQLTQRTREAQDTWAKYLTRGVSASSAAHFSWTDYFLALNKPVEALGDINVACLSYLTHFSEVLDSTALIPYLFFHAVNSFAPHLSSSYVQAHFAFHEQALKGTSELLPRWKRGLQVIDGSYALGEALGQLYVQKYFQESSKQRASYIVESVRQALADRLSEVEWMLAPETRAHALEKMRGFKVKIGYPDVWTSADGLIIRRANVEALHLQNVQAVRAFEFARDLARINAATDKTRWFMTPQTVNAYYHPSLNEIVFPAAILQPPFFDAKADLAVQFGSLGAVVGHEMTHGFDDQGRKYDSAGNLRDWWSAADGEEYARRAQRMIDQAAQFTVYEVALNGLLTCGENIADLGGVKLALRALDRELASNPSQASTTINGLTPHQRFFVAWSQSWRENGKRTHTHMLLIAIDISVTCVVFVLVHCVCCFFSEERASVAVGDTGSTWTERMALQWPVVELNRIPRGLQCPTRRCHVPPHRRPCRYLVTATMIATVTPTQDKLLRFVNATHRHHYPNTRGASVMSNEKCLTTRI